MKEPRELMLNSSMGALFWRLSIPSMMSTVVVALYLFIDAIFIGQWVGKVALAAVSLTAPLYILVNAISVLVGTGATSLLSRSIGSNEKKTISKIFSVTAFWTLLLSFIASALCIFYTDDLVQLLGAKDVETRTLAVSYIRVVLSCLPFLNLAMSITMMLRGEGRMRATLTILSIGTAVNILLDVLLIKGFNMGVLGAATSTAMTHVLKLLICIGYLHWGSSIITMSWPRPHLALFSKICSVGISGLAFNLMIVVQQASLFRMVSLYGNTTSLAVLGATGQVGIFCTIPLNGLLLGAQPVFGINFGASRWDRVRLAMRYFGGIAISFSATIWILIMLFSQSILGWFISDESVVAENFSLLRLALSASFGYGFILLSVIYFQSIGKGLFAAITVVSWILFFFLPLLHLLSRLWGLEGVFGSIAAADFCTSTLCLILMLLSKRAFPLKSVTSPLSP